ncbi:hypothetical protein K3G63_20890 [Hymenobacter sp. HSC-4F20]|uniref:hypothetical protein n=1 Tax=Hymenobacter sp. HSC-4F20 TaxID=2864135 RepID=UPI001C7318B0|nr:hypothetical protein [Hymenobacter sp. HSC-4F20]MBX0292912.1 hypothetical protein [Hymenobacter sp. HSC-4F20]
MSAPMKLNVWLRYAALSLLAVACQPQQDQPAESNTPATRAAVMRHHDELMARMDGLVSERQRLAAQLVGLDSATSSGRAKAERLHRTIRSLRRADAAMMNWMHQYKEPDTVQLTAHQYEDFWAAEAQELTELEHQMTAALDSARAVR